MATSRADVYADDAQMRATAALRRYVPVRGEGGTDLLDLASNAITDVRHWCDARGLDWSAVEFDVERKYQADRAGRPQLNVLEITPGCVHCEMVGAGCEEHQAEVPGRNKT